MFAKFIKNFRLKTTAEAEQKAYQRAINDSEQRRYAERVIDADVAFTRLLNKGVVYIPNEWQDPDFCIVLELCFHTDHAGRLSAQHDPLFKVRDVFTGETHFVPPASLYRADEQFVKALLKLTPMERWNLSAGKVHKLNLWKDPPEGYQPTDPNHLLDKLIAVGFFKN